MSAPPNRFALPRLPDLYSELRRGRHLCPEDGDLYALLDERPQDYIDLFSAIGYQLTRHRRGFYYLTSGAQSSDQMQRIAVFYFVLFDHLADRFGSVTDALFQRTFPASELPHFFTERYTLLMEEAKLPSLEALQPFLRRLESLGFLSIENDTIRFRSPSARFLDMCVDLANTPPAADEAGTETPE
ncbi:MAG: hypothetical protein CVV05_00295 [Gammaproteobacteria bacterium HGW-Gammaproteobacteria-1]|jgi:hypothetical protein|nr:MAG: hypothetical protein CVV05_00295 [Gammaproteobacteria bacterium HGW-Gammaproteobacteria-1]